MTSQLSKMSLNYLRNAELFSFVNWTGLLEYILFDALNCAFIHNFCH